MKTKLAAFVALLALPVAAFGATTIWLESGGQTAASVPAGTATLVIDVMVDFQYGDIYAVSGGLYMDNLASNVTIGAVTYATPVFSTWSYPFASPVGTNLSQHVDFGALSFGGAGELLAGPGKQKYATITLNGIGTLSAGVYHITVGDGLNGELAGNGLWASMTAPPGAEADAQPFDSTAGFTLTVQGGGGGGGGSGPGGSGTASTVSAVQVQTSLTVDVTFSGAMGTGVTTAGNYTVSGTGKGTLAANPSSVALVSGNTYRLTWTAGEMVSGGDITITVANVQDLAGNTIGSPNSGTHAGGGIGTAPTVSAVQVQTGLTVDVTFSEAMGTGVTTADNYTLSGSGQGTLAANPSSVALVSGNTYRLTWAAGEMVSGGDITITVANVQDLAGNTIGSPNSGTHAGGAAAGTNNGGSPDQTGGSSSTDGTDNSTGQTGQTQQPSTSPPLFSCGAGLSGDFLLAAVAGLSLLPRRRRCV